ncbi:MAG TPA: NAD-dependent epimerase/dehydratase family protein [Candidatus Saccharimonadales bacterium]|nr:NAD-dependent epimerase/dehydratase family protein [Candidatus Saccharimonadales bacterium]
MILLVTGAAGFLGRALVRAVLAADPEARVVGLDPEPPAAPPPARLAWERGSAADAGRLEQVLRAHRADCLAHLARGADTDECGPLMQQHVTTTLAVLQAAARHGGLRRVLVPGSAAEYGLVTEAELPISEGRPPRPASAYGYAKLAETSLALMAPAKLGAPALVARVFNPVGPGQTPRFVCGSLVAQFAAMRAAGRAEPLRLGARTPIRDFVDVGDVAEALRRLLLQGQPGECYNVGSGRGARVGEVVALLEELTGIRTPPGPAAAPPAGRPGPGTRAAAEAPGAPAAEHSVAAVEKLRAATGFECRVPLRQSLQAMLEAAYRFPMGT